MTSNADLGCYTKFDWLRQNVGPIKFHLTLFLRILRHYEKVPSAPTETRNYMKLKLT